MHESPSCALNRYGCGFEMNNHSLCVSTAVAEHELVPCICSGYEKEWLVILNKALLFPAFEWLYLAQ
jgi:hypothetical protein